MDLEQRFDFLDELPESLFRSAVVTRHGVLADRARGLMQWRGELLQGRLPAADALAWPAAGIAGELLPRLDVMEMPALCVGEEALTDHLLETLCVAVDSIDEWRGRGMLGLFDDILKQNRKKRDRLSDIPPDGRQSPPSAGQGQGQCQSQGQGQGQDQGQDQEAGGHHSAAERSDWQRPQDVPLDGLPGGRAAGSHAEDRMGRGSELPQGQAAERQAEQPDDGVGAGGPEPQPADAEHADVAAGQGHPAANASLHSSPQPLASASAQAAERQTVENQTPRGRAAAVEIAASLERQWQQLADNWRQTRELVSGMGTTLGRGWDLSQGRLRIQGWRDFVALRRWIKAHPALIALVDSLGREQPQPTLDSERQDTDPLATDPRASDSQQTQPVSTDAPTDTRGITRSDEIARMLPQEAAFLGHPLLKGLWHARRAEQALLTYRVQGVMSEHRLEPSAAPPKPRPSRTQAQQGRGPMMICLDTSASMHGEPETLAKAVCLEVLRLANQQQRDCLLFAFSGPGQVLEMPLSFSPRGLRKLIGFLRQSFAGGTDIAGPLRLALRRSREQRWRQADLLLISDGRFPLSGRLAAEVSHARRDGGLRIRGVSLGRWSGKGMQALCDSLLHFDPATRNGPQRH